MTVEPKSMNAEDARQLREVYEKAAHNDRRLKVKFATTVAMVPAQPELIDWEAQRQIFSVMHENHRLYPAFQFGEDGLPLPLMAELLNVLSKDSSRSNWRNAFWLFCGSGWLGGRTPMECLSSDPAAVLYAAKQETAPHEY